MTWVIVMVAAAAIGIIFSLARAAERTPDDEQAACIRRDAEARERRRREKEEKRGRRDKWQR